MSAMRGADIHFGVRKNGALLVIAGKIITQDRERYLVATNPGVLDGVQIEELSTQKKVCITWVTIEACTRGLHPSIPPMLLTVEEMEELVAGRTSVADIYESPAEEVSPSQKDLLAVMRTVAKDVKQDMSQKDVRITQLEQGMSGIQNALEVLIESQGSKAMKQVQKKKKSASSAVGFGSSNVLMMDTGAETLAPTLLSFMKEGQRKKKAAQEEDPEESEDSEEDEDDEDPMNTLLGGAGADPTQLIQLEMLKVLKGMQKSRRGGDSDSDDYEKKKKTGFQGVHTLKEDFAKNPKKIVKDYTTYVKTTLGVDGTLMPWRTRDLNKKLVRVFGKMRGLHRCHGMLAELFQLQLEGKTDHAAAYTVQAMKVLHQVAIDGGSWASAELLLPLGEGIEVSHFGGSEKEMVAIHAYHKALKELKASHTKAQEPDADEEEAPKAEGAGNSKKKKGQWTEKKPE